MYYRVFFLQFHNFRATVVLLLPIQGQQLIVSIKNNDRILYVYLFPQLEYNYCYCELYCKAFYIGWLSNTHIYISIGIDLSILSKAERYIIIDLYRILPVNYILVWFKWFIRILWLIDTLSINCLKYEKCWIYR